MLFAIPSASFGCINAMLHQTFLFLGQLWQLFEVSQILEFLRYSQRNTYKAQQDNVYKRIFNDPAIFLSAESLSALSKLKIRQKMGEAPN